MKTGRLLAIILCIAMLFSLVACNSTPADTTANTETSDADTEASPEATAEALEAEEPAPSAEAPYSNAMDGTYTDFGSGRNGFIYVSTTFENGYITKVEVGENSETESIAAPAFAIMPDRIVENNSIQVDTVSTCTLSCDGIVEAVKGCIIQAGATTDEYMTDYTTSPVSTGDATYDADVAIVGAGGAGLAAAVRAAELGLNVVMIEKRDVTGGALYGTECHYSNDSIVEEMFDRHDNQTADEGYEYHMNYNHNEANAEIVRYFMDNVGETINWFVELGNTPVGAYDCFRGPHGSTWFETEGQGPGVAVRMQKKCNELGVTTLTNTIGKELITDGGKVVGVAAETTGGDKITIHAEAVIIATGGFVDNEEMLLEYVGQGEAAASTSGGNRAAGGTGGRMGEGIQMAWDVGADKFGESHVAFCLNSIPGCAIDSPIHRAFYQPYFWVTANAVRFSPESRSDGYLRITQEPGGYFWTMLDSSKIVFMENNETISASCFTPPTKAPIDNLAAILDSAAEKGLILKADTWEELAAEMGLDEETFMNTLNEYNEYCRNGEDKAFNKSSDNLIEMDAEGPYYAAKMTGGMLTTIGGVKVDVDFHVIDTDGEIIPGLYCIGADAGGFYAETYNFLDSGCASTFSFLSGKTAAERIAETKGA